MTTIAWDGRFLAADGQIMSGSCIVSCESNKIRTRSVCDRWSFDCINVDTLCVAGNTGLENYLVKLLLSGTFDIETYLPETMDFCALMLTSFDKKPIMISKNEGTRELNSIGQCATPTAIGSGSNFAMGAMAAGANAIEAVSIACKYDCYSGGQVTYIDTGTRTLEKNEHYSIIRAV